MKNIKVKSHKRTRKNGISVVKSHARKLKSGLKTGYGNPNYRSDKNVQARRRLHAATLPKTYLNPLSGVYTDKSISGLRKALTDPRTSLDGNARGMEYRRGKKGKGVVVYKERSDKQPSPLFKKKK